MNSFKNINHKPRVKICCISSLEEANMAIEHGASVLGLVGHMPSGPGVISDERSGKLQIRYHRRYPPFYLPVRPGQKILLRIIARFKPLPFRL